MGQKVNNTQKDDNLIQISLVSAWTVPTTNTIVNFGATDNQVGTKLTRSGTGVVIGSGVSLVKVSYSLMGDTGGTSSYLFANTYKNSSSVSQQIDGSTSQFKSVSEANKLIAVTAGDVITIQASTGAGSIALRAGGASTMTVERVA